MFHLTRENEHVRGGAALTGAAFLYAVFGLIVREMEKMYNIGGQVFAGYALAFVVLSVFIFGMRNPLSITRAGLVKAAALGVTSGGAMILFTVAITELKLANAVFLFYGGGMLSSIPLGALLLKERFTLKKFVILFLALAGVALFGNIGVSFGWGAAASIAAGLLTSVSNALRKSLKEVPRHTITWVVSGVTSVMAIPIALVSASPVVHDPTAPAVIATLAYGASRIGLTYLMLYGFKHIDVSVGSVLLSTELVFSAMLGYLVFGETLAARECLGGMLVLIAAVLTAIPERANAVTAETTGVEAPDAQAGEPALPLAYVTKYGRRYVREDGERHEADASHLVEVKTPSIP